MVLIVSYDGGEKNETPFYANNLIATLAGIAFIGAGYFFPRAVDSPSLYFAGIGAVVAAFCIYYRIKNGKFDIPLLFL